MNERISNYIIEQYIFARLYKSKLKTDVYRDAYYRRFGVNLDLSPGIVTEHIKKMIEKLSDK